MRGRSGLLRRRPRHQAPPAVVSSGCQAPHAALYFGPDGSMRACCVNTAYVLGRAGEQTIREVWDGARTKALRDALDADDFSLGCQSCAEFARSGNRRWGNAAQYDIYAGRPIPDHPTRMDFVLSNTCNLQCEMCDGTLSSSIRSQREHLPPVPPGYPDSFFAELTDFLPHLDQAVFLGGEPFLARESRRVWDLMIELGVAPEISVTSNGTHWNDRVEHYLTSLPMSVAVSVDGATAATVESLRVGVDFARLTANLDRYQAALATHGGSLSLNYCLMVQNWHEFGQFLQEADARGVGVDVMTVSYPERFSLFALEADELATVVAALDRDDPRLRSTLDRNRSVWVAEVDRLRRHLEGLQGPQGVRFQRRETASVLVEVRPKGSSEVPAGVEAALDEWAGRPAIGLSVADDVITAVELPSWAPEILRDAPGRPLPWLAETVGAHLGATGFESTNRDQPWGDESDAVFTTESGPVEVRSLAIGRPRLERLRIAWPDPLRGASDG